MSASLPARPVPKAIPFGIHIEHYADLVKRIAQHLAARLPDSVQLDDLIQAGMMGLIEAAQHYDAAQGASFETYAGIRIRGAMIDETRRCDWTPRSVHRKAREAAAVTRKLGHQLGRAPKAAEIAQAMEVTLDEYYRIVADATGSQVLSFHQSDAVGLEVGHAAGDGSAHDPAATVAGQAYREALIDVVEGLPEKEQLVMSLYYEQELNLREIGEVLGVSESRVCQIHGQALNRIRARMHEWT